MKRLLKIILFLVNLILVVSMLFNAFFAGVIFSDYGVLRRLFGEKARRKYDNTPNYKSLF